MAWFACIVEKSCKSDRRKASFIVSYLASKDYNLRLVDSSRVFLSLSTERRWIAKGNHRTSTAIVLYLHNVYANQEIYNIPFTFFSCSFGSVARDMCRWSKAEYWEVRKWKMSGALMLSNEDLIPHVSWSHNKSWQQMLLCSSTYAHQIDYLRHKLLERWERLVSLQLLVNYGWQVRILSHKHGVSGLQLMEFQDWNHDPGSPPSGRRGLSRGETGKLGVNRHLFKTGCRAKRAKMSDSLEIVEREGGFFW